MGGEKEKDFGRNDSNATAATQRDIFPSPPHTLASDKLLQLLKTDPLKGLAEDEVAKLQEQYGPNRIKPPRKPSLVKIMGRQVVNGAFDPPVCVGVRANPSDSDDPRAHRCDRSLSRYARLDQVCAIHPFHASRRS